MYAVLVVMAPHSADHWCGRRNDAFSYIQRLNKKGICKSSKIGFDLSEKIYDTQIECVHADKSSKSIFVRGKIRSQSFSAI